MSVRDVTSFTARWIVFVTKYVYESPSPLRRSSSILPAIETPAMLGTLLRHRHTGSHPSGQHIIVRRETQDDGDARPVRTRGDGGRGWK